jgi:hypothetical protein
MKKHFSVLLPALITFISCNKADFCTETDTLRYKVDDVVLIESCSSDKYDAFVWFIDDVIIREELTLVANPIPFAPNFEYMGGANGCDGFIEGKFLSSGRYVLKLEVAAITSGVCGGDWEGTEGKTKEIEVIITD